MALVQTEERDISKLQSVSIIPKTYCSKCKFDYSVEMDNCKSCNHSLIRNPNLIQGKTKFKNSMGLLDYHLWESNKRLLKEKHIQRELDKRVVISKPLKKSIFNRLSLSFKILKGDV